MGRHAAEHTSQEEFILQMITREVERQFSDHPRKNGKPQPGMTVKFWDDKLSMSFTGTVVSADPLQINWRY